MLTPMENAIRYLIGKGLIKQQQDIAEKLKYDKSTVSAFVTGRTKLSKEFVRKFEAYFRIKLSDFQEGGENDSVVYNDPLQLLSERILKLEAYDRVNQSLIIEILAKVSGSPVMEVNRIASSAMDDELKRQMNELKQG